VEVSAGLDGSMKAGALLLSARAALDGSRKLGLLRGRTASICRRGRLTSEQEHHKGKDEEGDEEGADRCLLSARAHHRGIARTIAASGPLIIWQFSTILIPDKGPHFAAEGAGSKWPWTAWRRRITGLIDSFCCNITWCFACGCEQYQINLSTNQN
jgi:hypothetical protein